MGLTRVLIGGRFDDGDNVIALWKCYKLTWTEAGWQWSRARGQCI